MLAKFIEHCNVGFAQAPREAVGDFRLVPKKLNIDRILSLRYERVVMNNHMVPLGAKSIQLPPLPDGRGYAGARVELCHQPNGQLQV